MRDLVRSREDAVAVQRQARHRLSALLLHTAQRYAGKTAWTAAHRRWIARLPPAAPLVEAASAYRYGPAVSPVIAARRSGLPKPVLAIAWKAQLRLCARFRRLSARALNRNKIVVSIARELAGFVWAIGQQVKPRRAILLRGTRNEAIRPAV